MQESAGLQADHARLLRKMAAGAPAGDREALREALTSNEQLMADRAKVGLSFAFSNWLVVVAGDAHKQSLGVSCCIALLVQP